MATARPHEDEGVRSPLWGVNVFGVPTPLNINSQVIFESHIGERVIRLMREA